MPTDSNQPLNRPSEVDPTPLSQLLTYRIARLHMALDAQASAVLGDAAGISLAQWRLLVVLGSSQARSARDLVRMTRMDAGFVSRTLRHLEREGLVRMHRPDTDRRVLVVEMTRKGNETYRTALPSMRERQDWLLDSLDPSEREVAFRIIDKLENAAQKRQFGNTENQGGS